MLNVKRLDPNAKLPTVAHPGEDLGYDVYSLEHKLLEPFEVTKVRTGISVAFEVLIFGRIYSYGLLVRDRSSMAARGIITSAGVVDAGYRGELTILLTNTSDHTEEVLPGQKIAQMIPMPVLTQYAVTEVSELPTGNRGEKGFGSSGK